MSSQLAAVAFQPLDLDAVAELLYGPPYYRLLLRTRPVDPDLVPVMVELAFPVCGPRGRPRPLRLRPPPGDARAEPAGHAGAP